MSEISYFQKYSQKENHITNNTLLMLRHLYQSSPLKFEKFLINAFDDINISIGPNFEQQIRASKSVPDGFISQKPFNIFIEAKDNGNLDKGQIERHLEHAEKSNNAFIIGLTKEKLINSEKEEYEQLCKSKNVKFIGLTYLEIVESIKALVKEYETDLEEIVSDYEQFLLLENMISDPFLMISFPCGISKDANEEFGIYYEPSHRPSKANVSFLGFYAEKRISHIGSIKSTCICTYDGKNLNCKIESGEANEKDKHNIIKSIKAAESDYYHNLGSEEHRYYILKDLVEVNLVKKSAYGLMGAKYFNLKKVFNEDLKVGMSNSQIAALIYEETFE